MKNKNKPLKPGITTVIIVIIVVVLALIGVLVFFYIQQSSNSPTIFNKLPKVTSKIGNSDSNPIVSSNDNSDTALDKDLQTVGTNLDRLDSNSTSINQGLNQQATDPSSE